MSSFPSTSWTLVVSAGQTGATPGREALSKLCETYWRPLYMYARGRGYTPEDAADLTQGYLAKLVEKHYLRDARADQGRFRSFLLASFGNYLANEYDRASAQKRGGGSSDLSIDAESFEPAYLAVSNDPQAPETLFEKQWAATLIEAAVNRLRNDMTAQGKGRIYEAMKTYLTGEGPEESYRQQALRIGMTEGAFKTEVHRLRKRFRKAVREEVAATVESPDQIEGELRFLFEVLTR